MLELISIRELLRDPQYKAFFTKAPTLPDHYAATKPWRLMVQKRDEPHWRAKRFHTYREAFDGFKKMLPSIQDAAINCLPLDFAPPIRNVRVKGKFITVQGGHRRPFVKSLVWKPRVESDMEAHSWCPYCRRPSLFRYAGARKVTTANFILTPSEDILQRCIICGVSERMVNLRQPEQHQRWDPSRTRLYNL